MASSTERLARKATDDDVSSCHHGPGRWSGEIGNEGKVGMVRGISGTGEGSVSVKKVVSIDDVGIVVKGEVGADIEEMGSNLGSTDAATGVGNGWRGGWSTRKGVKTDESGAVGFGVNDDVGCEL